MIKAYSNDFGSDIFYTNTNGYLIHQWSRAPNKDTFYYRVLTEKMVGQPAIIHSQDVTYVYFHSLEKGLRRVMTNLNSLYDKPKTQISQDVMGCINPVCCQIGDQLCVCYIDSSGRLVEVRQSINKKKENKTRIINEKMMSKAMLKIILTQKGESLLFYRNISQLYWIDLQTRLQNQVFKKIDLPLRLQQNQSYQMVEKDGKIYLYAVTDERKVCEIVLDQENEEVLYSGEISNEIMLESYSINIELRDKDITIWFATSESKIMSCSKSIKQKDQKWDCLFFTFKKPLGTGLYIGDVNGKFKLLTLDQNQVLSSFSLPHYNSLEFQEEASQPYIIWEHIKEQCNPIGEGYWTNVYHHPQLNVAIKKFKKKKHEFWHKITQEILALKKIEKIQPHAFGARVFENGVLIGLSLPYCKGTTSWGQMLQNKKSQIHRSPVARVKLVIGLAKHIRQIQSINLCHGDIHLGNILMTVDYKKGTIVIPEVWVKVIDFGNAFSMEPGQLVSVKGLTGAPNLIPPEIQALSENDYDPYGYNPYQLLVIALMMLLKQNFTCEFTAEKNMPRVEKNNDYPQELKDWLRQLMNHKIRSRNDALNLDISHFQELTRQIYLQKHGRKASTPHVLRNRSISAREQPIKKKVPKGANKVVRKHGISKKEYNSK